MTSNATSHADRLDANWERSKSELETARKNFDDVLHETARLARAGILGNDAQNHRLQAAWALYEPVLLRYFEALLASGSVTRPGDGQQAILELLLIEGEQAERHAHLLGAEFDGYVTTPGQASCQASILLLEIAHKNWLADKSEKRLREILHWMRVASLMGQDGHPTYARISAATDPAFQAAYAARHR